jgi:hypothetical protein
MERIRKKSEVLIPEVESMRLTGDLTVNLLIQRRIKRVLPNTNADSYLSKVSR